ncbi:hypothetical protein OEA41_001250 [Lepraria neglecta]|uniref:Uncharacterized protein n=1 Tax=Lepraria neglecta TaxID=209136 RepID=A0AAE0DQ79_9LECA|nr:hypothetical protein OEA41_001250 [Lepraria neglecta]
MTGELPIPNVRHCQRIILSVIDELAQQEPNSTWVSMPIDEGDLSKGYKEITYGQFSNAVNHAVQWLRKTLPPSSEPSQSFAYAGSKDLRYPILAVAAGKLGKVVSSVVPPLFPYSAFYYERYVNHQYDVAFIRTVVVLGPSTLPPTPDIVRDIIKYGHPNGALLPPALIDQLCLDPSGLSALRSLDYIHYCGAPLGISTGAQLIPYVRVSPSIGSTEAGGYFVELRESAKDWEYISFQPFAGARFERRLDNLYELVFVRRPEYAAMQQVFMAHPDESRYETNDLWVEHSERKGLWKIVGRTDDYVYLAHGEGLHASTLEPEIERDQLVKAALIGGHSRPKPVLLIELVPDAQTKAESEAGRRALLESLQPYLDKVNAQCHPSVQLSQELIIFAKTNKPFERTAKGSVARAQSLQLYEDDIETIYTQN